MGDRVRLLRDRGVARIRRVRHVARPRHACAVHHPQVRTQVECRLATGRPPCAPAVGPGLRLWARHQQPIRVVVAQGASSRLRPQVRQDMEGSRSKRYDGAGVVVCWRRTNDHECWCTGHAASARAFRWSELCDMVSWSPLTFLHLHRPCRCW